MHQANHKGIGKNRDNKQNKQLDKQTATDSRRWTEADNCQVHV